MEKLPPAYQASEFNGNIPVSVLIGENIFRTIIFVLPLFLKFDWEFGKSKIGLITYGIGSCLYYLSWLALIFLPNSVWSLSLIGFIAPAYTPIVWLVGISFIANKYYFNTIYSKWHLLIPSILFSGFHISHAIIVYNRSY
ncbi:hypothetical protein CH352_18850 [Leptospira hartskeerlii]|uniref:Uncharacterized protein n=1 Tax=Leptospira hartskeerlii TaxID=2023177 RepID=A0A2M9X868_9LEPT|nr:hypothetical protein CH357_18785 [Leptospira hartskeerlii]PJZ31915.1 hypothetical protein CH352_18850 [Leptospira hartskeerlii]